MISNPDVEAQDVNVSHYCLKCKKKVEIVVREIVQGANGSRWYAVGECPSCLKTQKRCVSGEFKESWEKSKV